MSLALTCLLPAFFAFLVAGAGQAFASGLARRLQLPPLNWIERLCLGAAAVVLLLALLGLAVSVLPHGARSAVSRGALVLLGGWSAVALARGGFARVLAATRTERVFALAYLALCALSLLLALWPTRLPDVLVDGPYVAKHNLLGVRVQYTTGNLPTDNAIPHVVSEYLLRDLPFRTERPIMPGQEVTNRPILAALALVPLRAATYMPETYPGPLPRFTYVGSEWPDFSWLMRDERGYRVSQAVGIAMNALLLLALGALASRRVASTRVAFAVTVLFLSSPYFLFQTYFTWPKALAGFFVILAWLAVTRFRAPSIAGASLGLAYMSHPYAIAFFAAYFAWHVWECWRAQETGRRSPAALALAIGRMGVPFAAVVAPWFLWKAWLAIPSDLVAQNLVIAGQRGTDFVWARLANMLNTVLPIHLLAYPFDLLQVIRASSINLSGALGFITALALAHAVARRPLHLRELVLWGGPAALLIGVFSNPAVPIMHGLQPVAAVLLLAAVVHLFEFAGSRWGVALVSAQAFTNVLMLARYFRRLL